MRLILFHPEFDRTCADCQKYLYDDDGLLVRRPARTGLPVLRPKGAATPCHKCPKIPKGEAPLPTNAQELSEKNRRAFGHYLQCRAVGRFPEDPIVRRNAVVIREVHDEFERRPLVLLTTILGGKF